MSKRLSIPDEYHDLFQKMLGLLPYELRNNTDIHNIILVYLKIGGEKLARHGIEIIKKRFIAEIRKKAEESENLNAVNSEVDTSGGSDNDDTVDSESNDTDDEDS